MFCGDEQAGSMDATKDYIAGLAAGVATVLIGHPFDTVKVSAELVDRAEEVEITLLLLDGCCI
jgi:hypothetical protein